MTTHEFILYFAYGSNMSSARLRQRVPSATAVAIGKLPGHQLRWHKRSRDGSGKCDAQWSEDVNESLWGVIFKLSTREKPALDAAEGLGKGYEEKTVEVDTANGVLTACTYVATDTDSSLQPYSWYQALVIAGAREHALPLEYVSMLENQGSKADCDAQRAAKEEAFLPRATLAVDDPFKPVEEVTQPDSRQAFFAGTLADRHRELAAFVLHVGVPREVRQLFETAKNLALYSWYVYPFHQVAELVAFAALEMALRSKFDSEKLQLPKRRKPTLRELLQLAHEKQWLRDDRFDMLPALAARRIRDRAVMEAILQITQNPRLERMVLPEREPSEEAIQAEMKEIRFVEHLWQTIPDLRNQLAHGSSVLHPNSRYTLSVTCQAISQLFPQATPEAVLE